MPAAATGTRSAPTPASSAPEKRVRASAAGARVPAAEYDYDLVGGIRSKTKFKGVDGVEFLVADAAALISGSMAAFIRQKEPNAPTPDVAYQLENVQADVLETVLEYCYFHASTARAAMTKAEADEWDEEFADLDPRQLCELASAAYYLDIKALVDLTCKAIAGLISGKSADEIRNTFNIENDLDSDFLNVLPPEWYAPGAARGNKLRTRLLTVERHARRISRAKAAAAAERAAQNAATQQQADDDEGSAIATASVEEIMNYIDGGKTSSSTTRAAKRRRARKRAQQAQAQSNNQNHAQNSHDNDAEGHDTRNNDHTLTNGPSGGPGSATASTQSASPRARSPSATGNASGTATSGTNAGASKRARQRARRKGRRRAEAEAEAEADVGRDEADGESEAMIASASASSELLPGTVNADAAKSGDSGGGSKAKLNVCKENGEDLLGGMEMGDLDGEFSDEEALHHMDEEVEAFARRLNLDEPAPREALRLKMIRLQRRAQEIEQLCETLRKERLEIEEELKDTERQLRETDSEMTLNTADMNSAFVR